MLVSTWEGVLQVSHVCESNKYVRKYMSRCPGPAKYWMTDMRKKYILNLDPWSINYISYLNPRSKRLKDKPGSAAASDGSTAISHPLCSPSGSPATKEDWNFLNWNCNTVKHGSVQPLSASSCWMVIALPICLFSSSRRRRRSNSRQR